MKVHVPRKELSDTLGYVERVIPNRSSNPGLHLIKLELSERGLIFSGSNMDIDILAKLSADVEGSGTFALPAQVFSQVVKALPGDLVTFDFESSELEIAAGGYATRLQLVDAAAAPLLHFPDDYEGSLDAEQLGRALGNVRYAAAVAEYQAIFRGVKLELQDDRTRAVATDGFRLAYYNLAETSGLLGDIVIPARSVEEITRLLTHAHRVKGGEVALQLSAPQGGNEGSGGSFGQLSMDIDDYKLNVKLMEGSFPDYERIIPNEFPVNITLDAKVLAETVSRVAVMADRTANNRVDFFIKGGVVQITAEGSYGRSQEALPVSQEGSDPEMALAYNAKYLVDALAPLKGELRLSFSGTTSPSVVVDLSDSGYLAMVVPLRTG